MEDFSLLPETIRAILFGDEFDRNEKEIFSEFRLTGVQIASYGKIFRDILFGRKRATELVALLAKLPGAQSIDVRALARAIAERILWLLSDHVQEVAVVIRRLGGTVPKEKPQIPVSSDEASGWIHGPAIEVLNMHKHYGELYLTQRPLRDDDDRLKVPFVNNWLSEYRHIMGAGEASSIKRSQYMARSRNASKLNDAEKRNLLNFLQSYDEGVPMYWRIAEGQYLIVEPEMVLADDEPADQDNAAQKLTDVIKRYHQVQDSYRSRLESVMKGIEIEINDNPLKLRDIVWDGLGLTDADRTLAAISMLIQRHAFEEMLKTDQRIIGIVRRQLDVGYGTEAKRFWDEQINTAPMMVIFWKLLLTNKLGLDEDNAAIVADMFRIEMGGTTSSVYLDRKSGKFKFREVAYENREFKIV